MFRNKLHSLASVMVGTALSYGAFSAQLGQQAQAAVLTSNFQVNVFFGDGFQNTYGGAFNFDDSSLTGQGEESANVLSGVFNFIQPGRTAKAYDLTGAKVDLLDGKLLGLSSISGEAVSQEVMRIYTVYFWDQGQVDVGLHGLIKWSINLYPPEGTSRLGGFETFQETPRFDRFFSGEVVYSEPAEIGATSVPEPTVVIGTALGIVSLVQLKRSRKSGLEVDLDRGR